MERRRENYKNIIPTTFPDSCPIILAYDNINIHKGRARHARLKGRTVPIMWNFTGKAVIKPWIDEVKHLFEDTKTASEPQKLLKDIKLEDVQLG